LFKVFQRKTYLSVGTERDFVFVRKLVSLPVPKSRRDRLGYQVRKLVSLPVPKSLSVPTDRLGYQVRMNTTKFGARYTLLYFLSFCLNPFVLLFVVLLRKTKGFKQKDSNKRIQTKKSKTTKQQQKEKYKKALIVKHIKRINLHTEGEFFNNLEKNYYL